VKENGSSIPDLFSAYSGKRLSFLDESSVKAITAF
jgi:hypothetical protein